MSLTRRFYALLSGTEFGNLGPEMYVKREGLKDYAGVVDDPLYHVGRAEKDVWHQCARVVTAYVPLGYPTVELGVGDAKEVRKTAATVTALASPHHMLYDYSREAIAQALVTIDEINEELHARSKQGIQAVGVQGDFWDDGSITENTANGIAAGIPLGNLAVPWLRREPVPELAVALHHLVYTKLHGGCLLFTVDLKLPRFSRRFYLQSYSHPIHDHFNLGVLSRVVEETTIRGLDPRRFRRVMLYNDSASQIAMMAASDTIQKVIFEGTRFTIRPDEPLHINNVLKYSPRTLTMAVKHAELDVCLYIRHATPLRLVGVVPRTGPSSQAACTMG